MKKELVWVIPIEKWREIEFEGFKTDDTGFIYRFLLKNGLFLDRESVENDLNYKQIIPQGILVNKDKVYLTERLPKQSEQRLNYAYSIGVGGHLNPEDNILPHMDLMQVGLHREMAEEVEMTVPFSPKFIGLTNDETQEVSKHHLGVWFEVSLLDDNVKVREVDKLKGFWVQRDKIVEDFGRLESWSQQILINFLKK